ncbi:hypothetical protein RBWH47_02038 [Rhodopirellula baltica WH47]|uniref:Uncharacterized protein n=1 Tax=Rhodopirellula baltica WH47 TaxID=991778 RepID=F2AS92_RHOBT|nr:hypothetical protein RBWH47_02038 [Rhodopirellula baltica WH47]
MTRFGKGEIKLQTEGDVEQQAKRLISLVRKTHSQSSSAAHRRFKEIAAAVDDQIGLIDQSEKHMKMLFERLIRAAELEVDVLCPWAHLLPELEYSSKQLAVANALWHFNKDLADEWTLPLGDFARTVWGYEEKSLRTIRPAVSKFVKFITSRGVNLKVSVRFREGVYRIDCKLS